MPHAPRTAAPRTAAAVALVLGAAMPAMALSVESRFDTGAEGWTLRDLFPPHAGGQAPDYLADVAAIGANDKNAYNVFAAPAEFVGNLAAFGGGRLAFELSDTVRDADNLTALYPTLVLQSGNTLLGWFGGPPGTAMTSFSATLSASAAWRKAAPSFGPSNPVFARTVSKASFRSVLGAVDAVYINADWKGAGPVGGENDYARLDNVVLSTAAAVRPGDAALAAGVPEPGSLVLMTLGLAAFVGLARHRSA